MPTTISPRPGFDWAKVKWGGPKDPRTEHCSYCGDKLPTDDEDPSFVPLILWASDGSAAEFCDTCQAQHWGIQTFDEAVPPVHEIEARAAYRSDAYPENTTPMSDTTSHMTSAHLRTTRLEPTRAGSGRPSRRTLETTGRAITGGTSHRPLRLASCVIRRMIRKRPRCRGRAPPREV